MIVTVDVDYDKHEWIMKHYTILKRLGLEGSRIKIRCSATKGSHVLIENDEADNYHYEMILRNLLGDDEKRILCDEERHAAGLPTGVLFDYKIMLDGTKKRAGEWQELKI